MRPPGGQSVESVQASSEEASAEAEAAPAVSQAVLEAFAREHRPFLQALARKLCRGHFDPEDLVQDVLERMLKGYARLPQDADVRSWLARIMHNRFIDLVRRRDARPGTQSYDDERTAAAPLPSNPAWQRVSIEDVQAKLAELPRDLREIYECHVVLKLSYTETAERLRIPIGTVGTRLQRARRRLRELVLGKDGESHD
ncbi:MAG TPA: RNA polymerase sigma factor [Kofleriaceae bacterium]|jgi:RNA polymerase sigma-70 factor (ECF subfamily)